VFVTVIFCFFFVVVVCLEKSGGRPTNSGGFARFYFLLFFFCALVRPMDITTTTTTVFLYIHMSCACGRVSLYISSAACANIAKLKAQKKRRQNSDNQTTYGKCYGHSHKHTLYERPK
jgi:hypothetical protein